MTHVLNHLFSWAGYCLSILKIAIFFSLFFPLYRVGGSRDGFVGMIGEIVSPIYSLFSKISVGPLDFSPMVIFLIINYLQFCFAN